MLVFRTATIGLKIFGADGPGVLFVFVVYGYFQVPVFVFVFVFCLSTADAAGGGLAVFWGSAEWRPKAREEIDAFVPAFSSVQNRR